MTNFDLGIDGSSWSGAIRWEVARAHQVTWATLRATYGPAGKDTLYQVHAQAAAEAAILHHPYHWYIPNKLDPLSSHIQAANFLASAERDSLAPMLDLEDTKTVKGYRGVHVEIRAWLEDVGSAFNTPPWVYTNQDFAQRYLYTWAGKFLEECRFLCEYPLVVASWNQTAPTVPMPWHPERWAAWQFYAGPGGPYYGLTSQTVSLYVAREAV